MRGNTEMFNEQAKALVESVNLLQTYNKGILADDSLENDVKHSLCVPIEAFTEYVGYAVEQPDLNITSDEIKAIASGCIKNKIKVS